MKKIFVQINGIKSGPFNMYPASHAYFMYGDHIMDIGPLKEMGAYILDCDEATTWEGEVQYGESTTALLNLLKKYSGSRFKVFAEEIV